jgi:hypothetical protein
MRGLATIFLLLFLGVEPIHFAESSVYPFDSDLHSSAAPDTSLKSYYIGMEVIEDDDTQLGSITTIFQPDYGSPSNFSNCGHLLVTRNSFLVNVTKGKVSLDFFAYDGTIVTLATAAGNSYEFEPKSFTITSSAGNSHRVLVSFDETDFFLPPGKSTQIVDMVIMPMEDYYPANPGEPRLIPVVIFGSIYLDVNNIDIESLNLESLTVKTEGGTRYFATVDLVNEDDYPDLIVVFEGNETFRSRRSSHGTLRGNLVDGTTISGKDNSLPNTRQ